MKTNLHSRITHLRTQIEVVTGQKLAFGVSADCPPEIEEAFLQRVLAFETAEAERVQDVLRARGFYLPAADQLRDRKLKDKLWKLILALAQLNVALEYTNHLSDREVYTWLRAELVAETNPVLLPKPGFVFYLNPVGRAGEGDMELYLTYYAAEQFRQRYSIEFPDSTIPEHRDPPYKRDHLLPGRARPG